MRPDIPWYITATILAVDLVIVTSVWWILSRAAGRSGLPAAAARTVRIGAGALLGLWFLAALALAPRAMRSDPFAITPAIPVFSLAPLVLIAIALAFSPAFRRVLASASLPALIGVQAYRVIGAIFLVLFAQGRIPGHFALPAGWGDVAVGITAPLVALALARGLPGARGLALSWVVIGLLDLGVAVGMGTGVLAPYLAPGLGDRVPPVGPMGAYPLIMVPALAVPISVTLHAIALARLAGPGRSSPVAREALEGTHR